MRIGSDNDACGGFGFTRHPPLSGRHWLYRFGGHSRIDKQCRFLTALREARAGLLFASAASVVSTAGCTSAAGGEAVVAATELLSVRAFDLRATLFAVTLEATGAAYSFAAAGAASYASDSGRLVDAHPVWI
jgi:hypothetical protein